MIVVTLLSLLAAGQDAAVASSRPAQAAQARRVPKGVVVPNAMAPVYKLYVDCMDRNTDRSGIRDRASLRRQVEAGIAACRSIRPGLIAQADRALAADPAYKDPNVRAQTVARTFDTHDQIQHAMAEGRVLYEDE